MEFCSSHASIFITFPPQPLPCFCLQFLCSSFTFSVWATLVSQPPSPPLSLPCSSTPSAVTLSLYSFFVFQIFSTFLHLCPLFIPAFTHPVLWPFPAYFPIFRLFLPNVSLALSHLDVLYTLTYLQAAHILHNPFRYHEATSSSLYQL